MAAFSSKHLLTKEEKFVKSNTMWPRNLISGDGEAHRSIGFNRCRDFKNLEGQTTIEAIVEEAPVNGPTNYTIARDTLESIAEKHRKAVLNIKRLNAS